MISQRLHKYLTSISQRLHNDIASISHRSDITFTTVPHHIHNDITTMSHRYHIDLTPISHRSHIGMFVGIFAHRGFMHRFNSCNIWRLPETPLKEINEAFRDRLVLYIYIYMRSIPPKYTPNYFSINKPGELYIYT